MTSPEPALGHSSLGLQWDLESDLLYIKTEMRDRPMTRRGLLGTIMSPYDPMGIAAPAMLKCKLFQREVLPPSRDDPHNYHKLGWDDPLPSRLSTQWKEVVSTCLEVQNLVMPRSYYPAGHGIPVKQQLFAFADASDLAFCCAVYIRTITSTGEVFVAFVYGSSNVLPKGTTYKGCLSIPRAELCAATSLAEKVRDIEFELKAAGKDSALSEPTQYFTDSQDVLDWLANTKDRQKRYVANRIRQILTNSSLENWHHIPTDLNPADIGTRPISVSKHRESL